MLLYLPKYTKQHANEIGRPALITAIISISMVGRHPSIRASRKLRSMLKGKWIGGVGLLLISDLTEQENLFIQTVQSS